MKKVLAIGKAFLIILLVWAVIGTALVTFHRPILRALAHAWIVQDPPFEKVDAILIPGGNLEVRPFAAAEYYHEGKSKRLVTFVVKPSPSEELGITRPAHDLTIEVLKALKVPRDAIVILDDTVSSSKEELEGTKRWCRENGIHSLAVLTDTFPSRRIARLYRKGFQDSGIEVHIVALEQLRYTPNNWWLDEDGLISFQNEFIKYLYYRVRY